jgi:NAD+ kinase
MRPLVLPDDATLRVVVHSRAENFQLSMDNNIVIMPNECAVIITKSPYDINVVQRKGHSFAETLREKLFWGKDNR